MIKIMKVTDFKIGQKVEVIDMGLIMFYNTMKKFNPKAKPSNLGWVLGFE